MHSSPGPLNPVVVSSVGAGYFRLYAVDTPRFALGNPVIVLGVAIEAAETSGVSAPRIGVNGVSEPTRKKAARVGENRPVLDDRQLYHRLSPL